MGVIEFQMKTHSRENITHEFNNLNPCIKHNRTPTIMKIVAGRRKEEHFCAWCDEEECDKISYDRKGIAEIWNKWNSK
jgi:hypothetical protein